MGRVTERAKFLALAELADGMEFRPLDLMPGEAVEAVWGLARVTGAGAAARWYAISNRDSDYWAPLMAASLAELQGACEQVVVEDRPAIDAIAVSTPPGIVVTRQPSGLSFHYGESTSYERIGMARLMRKALLDMIHPAERSETTLPITDLVNDETVVLGPAECGELDTDIDYLMAVFFVDDAQREETRLACRASGPVNKLELIGALDVELERLRRVIITGNPSRVSGL